MTPVYIAIFFGIANFLAALWLGLKAIRENSAEVEVLAFILCCVAIGFECEAVYLA